MSRLRHFFVLLTFAALAGGVNAGPLTIVVHKEARKLELHQDGQVIKTYRVGLGFAPVGHKQQSGDGKTPEGHYTICVKNPQSRYYLSLGIDYPAPADADRGLAAGLITKEESARIHTAHKKGVTPPWNTRLGGEIFIHGKGASSDWTLGCVALDDAEMKDLFDRVPAGTAVEIRK